MWRGWQELRGGVVHHGQRTQDRCRDAGCGGASRQLCERPPGSCSRGEGQGFGGRCHMLPWETTCPPQAHSPPTAPRRHPPNPSSNIYPASRVRKGQGPARLDPTGPRSARLQPDGRPAPLGRKPCSSGHLRAPLRCPQRTSSAGPPFRPSFRRLLARGPCTCYPSAWNALGCQLLHILQVSGHMSLPQGAVSDFRDRDGALKLDLVSSGCCNKRQCPGGVEDQGLVLSSSGAGSPTSGCGQSWFPLETLRAHLSCASPLVSGRFWTSLALTLAV